jgi:hypothetical protein
MEVVYSSETLDFLKYTKFWKLEDEFLAELVSGLKSEFSSRRINE